MVRVEVGPGDLYGAEYSGKSQVLNVILSADGGIDGNVTAVGAPALHRLDRPRRSGSALIRRGASTINLSAGTEQRPIKLEEGTDTLTDLDTGELIEFRRKHNSYRDSQPLCLGQLGARARQRQRRSASTPAGRRAAST